MLRINVQLCVKKGCKTFILRQKYNFQEKQPLVEHAEQVHKYTGDTLKKKFPDYRVHTYMVYIYSNRGWICWEVAEYKPL